MNEIERDSPLGYVIADIAQNIADIYYDTGRRVSINEIMDEIREIVDEALENME